MDAATIARHRLHNHHITQPRLQTPSEVVGWLGAIQGQDYAGAKWSIGLRLPGSTDASIERAFDERAIVRSWLLRGTLHVVSADDLGWMLDLIAPRVIAGNARRYRELELDDATLARSNDILAAALRDGAQRERGELLAILEQHGISTAGQRAAYMLQRASLDGLICQGAARRNKPTFYAFDHLPRSRTLVRDEALAKLARRYFTSRGPATLQDFIWWSGLAASDARAGLESIRSELVAETVNGAQAWRPASEPPGGELPPVLLPGFDEYLLGYQDRSAVLDPRFAQQVAPGGNGMFSPTIAIGGRVVGTWKRDVKKHAVVLTRKLFEPLSDEDLRAFERAAQPYGAFLGLPVTQG